MANNLIQVKRTSVAKRVPNTTNAANTSYILPGELALNMADGILYTSNGSGLISFGTANLTVRSINGSGGQTNTVVSQVTGINFDESTGFHVTNEGSGNVFVSLGSGYKYITVSGQTAITAFGEDTLNIANGENIYLTTTNTAPKTLTIAANLSSYIQNSYTGDLSGNINFTGKTSFNGNIALNSGISIIDSTGNVGIYGSVLSSNGSGNIYWQSIASLSVNTDAQYIWSNTHTFSNTITFNNVINGTANNSNNLNGKTEANLNVNSSITANSSNNASYLNGKTEENLNVNSSIIANSATYIIANTGLISNSSGVFVDSVYINTVSANLAYYVLANDGIVSNTSGIFVNTAYINTISSNAASYLNGKTEFNLNVNSAVYANNANTTNYIIANTGLVSNLSGVFVNTAYINAISANAATYLNGKTESNLNVNTALTANSSTYLGTKTEANLNVNNALTANNSSYLNNKTEENLNVNNSITANSANNSSYLNNKSEANLNVNNALTANNSSYLNNKSEANLNVNNSITSNSSNNSSYLNNKTEENLNVNSALTSNNSSYLNNKSETNLNVNNAVTSNTANTANTANYIIANTGIVSNSVGVFVNTAFINTISANAASYLNGKTESNLNVNNALTANSSNYIGSLPAANVVSDSQLSSNLSYYTNTAGLPNVVGNNTANDVFYVNGVTSVNVVSNGQLTDNLARFTPTSSFYLDTLQDVSAGGPTSGQILTWNSTTNQWTPQAPPTVVTGVTPGYYGSFYDANANQTISSTTSAYLVRVANTFEQNGITVVNNTDITFAYTGTYEITFSIQFFNNDNSQQDINVWFYKNGNNNITNSDSKFTINGKSGPNKGKLIAVTPFLSTFNAGDYVRLAWAATDTGVEITTDAAGTTPAHPVVPGVIVTVKQISNIISAPPGTNSQIMFNDSGVSNATAGFTFNKTTNNITTGNSLFVTSTVNAAAFTIGSQFIANSTFVYANNGVNFTPKAGTTTVTTEGSIFYDSLNHALNVYTDIGDSHELGQQTFVRVYNATGSTITKGTAVYVNGANANRPTIGKAISNGVVGVAKSIGLVYNDIPGTSEGFVLTSGLFQNVDTRSYSTGQEIYISSTTAGSLSNTQPSYPNYSTPIGYALNSALAGQMYLNIQIPALTLPNTNIYISNGSSAFVSNNFTFDYANSVLHVGNSTVNASIGYVDTAGTTTFLGLYGNSNSSLDGLIVNYSAGTNASSDFAAYDSSGTSSSNFIDMGINGINWNESFWTINGPSDGYLYTGNNSLAIGTAQAYPIIFFTGGTLSTDEKMRLSPTGNVGINNTNPLDKLSINGTTYHGGKTTFNANLVIRPGISIIDSTGAQGTSGQVLTSNGTSNVYWSTLLGVNTASQYAFTNTISFSNVVTHTANISVNGAIIANGGIGTSGQVLTSSAGGNVYWSSGVNFNVNSALTANLSTYIIANTGLISNSSGVFVNSAYVNTISSNLAYYIIANTGLVSNATGVYVNATYINTISSNLAYYVIANTGLVSNATGVFINQGSQFTWTNTQTFSNTITFNGQILANTVNGFYTTGSTFVSNTTGLYVNSAIFLAGSNGQVGQVLTSNGAGNVYWSSVSSGGSVNTAAVVAFTNTAISTNAISGAVTIVGGLGVSNNIYAAGRVGFSNSTNISVAYTYYNQSLGTIDTVFG